MSGISPPSPARRDRDLRRVRGATWAAGAAAAALAAGLSVAAAQAFKGHDGTATPSAPAPVVRVPPAQDVPPIAGDPRPLQAPTAAPTVAPPQPAPEAETSGGS